MGMTLATRCDLRLAARNTVLGQVKHGMISAATRRVCHQVIRARWRWN
jgi:hypothetical protein